ncbi:MAG: polysaccharide biosynthesis tyrosine autokinase [Janthinobacterium lividum]
MIFSLPSNESNTKSNKKIIGIKDILRTLLINWQLFIISILCCLGFAALYSTNHTVIIDTDSINLLPTELKKITIYIFGLIIGLFLPAVFLLIKELLDIHLINTKADIYKITSVPIIGLISHETNDENLVVNKALCSVVFEELSEICTNLQFNLDIKKSNVLLITSSISGEGKSFLSLNLGSALALGGKKVLFLEFDLRKPKLSERIGMDNSYGFTNYLTSDTVTIESIIKPVWFHKNCFIISSGSILSNPAEIWANGKVEILINALRNQFDYVIIDSAPVGLISDALQIEKLIDLTLYVVRQKYTYKSQLDILNDLKQTGKFKKLYLIMNDIKSEKNIVDYFKKYFYRRHDKSYLID